MARALEVTGGLTLVSDVDYDRLAQYNWRIDRSSASGKPYVKRSLLLPDGRTTSVYMHREITGCPRGLEVDHGDRDGLNNQRYNLTICTGRQNRANREAFCAAGYKGVTRSRSKFRARITFDSEAVDLGSFHTAEAAARAYDAASYELYGEFANLNFPTAWPVTDIQATF